ncbi:hypothetical protein U9M48_004910 [Paspalum notatum var. saurae]|uniref:Uncharacterized protein n=1 Tax=Paspalum notatum var. saurae TaxID=547442 RepID=A0AAQ3PU89_PASNO
MGFSLQDLHHAEAELNNPKVLFRGTHWLRFWAQLQRTDDMKIDIVRTCRSLESAAMELFVSHGWPFMFRIEV